MSTSRAEQLNIDLHRHREKQRTGQERPRFASGFVGADLQQAENTLRESRDQAAATYQNTMKSKVSAQDSLPIDTLNFSQEFALHRDFKARYASTPALRRRGLASARQKHGLGRVFHRYIKVTE